MNKKLFFIIGACGSGKTLALEGIEKRLPKAFGYCYYDTLGTPTDEEVYRDYGSWDEWHRHLTGLWLEKIKKGGILAKKPCLMDCQARPDHIEAACDEHGIDSYEVILLECSFEERKKRLFERGTPHVVTETLKDWSRYLHDECARRGYTIIDNTDREPKETHELIVEHIRRSIGKPRRKGRRIAAPEAF